MLKKILIAVGVIVALPFIAALFVANEYHVERTVTINKPLPSVFNYIKYLKNQDNFSKWANIDPAMTKSYRGTDAEPGFVSAWQSDHPEVGHGEQEIIKLVENQRIDYELRFLTPFESTSPAFMITEENGDKTTVTWGFSGRLNYPMNLLIAVMDFENAIGNDLQVGLDNLKVILEQ